MNTNHALASLTALLLLAGSASGGTVTFLEIERSVSAVGAGDVGFGCTTVPVGDDTDRFGPFFSTTGIPLFTAGSSSQLSSVSPSTLVFGDGEVVLGGIADCDGNAVASTIELRFSVDGQLMLLLEGSVSATGNAAVTSTAAVIIEKEEGARTVYDAVATAGEGTPSSSEVLESPLILTSGTYVLSVFATAQDALLGEVMAGSATYDVSISFPAVNNDDCPAAEPIELDGFYVFDTTFATTDGPPEPACFATGGGDQIEADVWYVYQSVCDAWLILSTCGLADFDTRMAVYDGCPGDGGGVLVECDDDAPKCFGGTSQVLVPVYSGRTYLVRIGGADGARGAGGLLVTCEIPNDYCEDILSAGAGAVAFSTVGATTDGPPLTEACAVAGDDQIHNDIWFQIVAECTGALRVSACGMADFDTRVAIYSEGCPSDSSTLLGCGMASPGCGPGSSAVASVVAGQNYVIRVGGAAFDGGAGPAGQSGHGTLLIECGVCPADLNGDLAVDGADLGELLAAWGKSSTAADLNDDGMVDGADIGAMLSAWGPCQ